MEEGDLLSAVLAAKEKRVAAAAASKTSGGGQQPGGHSRASSAGARTTSTGVTSTGSYCSSGESDAGSVRIVVRPVAMGGGAAARYEIEEEEEGGGTSVCALSELDGGFNGAMAAMDMEGGAHPTPTAETWGVNEGGTYAKAKAWLRFVSVRLAALGALVGLVLLVVRLYRQ